MEMQSLSLCHTSTLFCSQTIPTSTWSIVTNYDTSMIWCIAWKISINFFESAFAEHYCNFLELWTLLQNLQDLLLYFQPYLKHFVYVNLTIHNFIFRKIASVQQSFRKFPSHKQHKPLKSIPLSCMSNVNVRRCSRYAIRS